MQNNLTVAGVLRAKKFVVDDLPTGIEEVEITESAVSGGNNVITFTYTNGESQTFNVKNGEAGKTMGAFAIVADATDKSGWDTAKGYLVLTETDGEFDVYSYENEAWNKIDTIEIDLNYNVVQTTGQSASDVMSQKAVTDSLVGNVISYDNSQSGLTANNVQGALDETASDVSELMGIFSGVKLVERFTLTGNNRTSAVKRFFNNLIAGETYRLTIDLDTFDYSNSALNGYNIFSAGYFVGSQETEYFTTIKGRDTVVAVHEFVAADADYTYVLIRANAGCVVQLKIEEVVDNTEYIDEEPTEGSDKLVRSGGVYNSINNIVNALASTKFSIIGNGNTGVDYRFYPQAGSHCILVVDLSTFIHTNVDNGYNIYSVFYRPKTSSTSEMVFRTMKGTDALVAKHEFDAVDAEYYVITIRANVGQEVDFSLTIVDEDGYIPVDNVPTKDSQNLVRSGGVYALIDGKTDIVSLNDENRTLRYLRNLRRPNYSRDGRYAAGLTPFTLLHFSDLHSDKVNLKRLVEYKEHYAEYIDDAILTGDNIRNKFGDSFAFWSECGADNILLSTGNHEYYNGEHSAYYTQITPLQVYNKFFAPYYQNWGTVVFPTDADVNGYNYYYKDYTAKKIRLIVLDNMANMKGERDGVQAAWLATVLESARTAGLHVICAIHIGSTIETRFNNPFTSEHAYINRDSGANAGTFAEFYTLREAVRTFIDNGGKFVAWIAGHRHVDTIAVLTDDVRQGTIHVATASGGEFSSNAGGHGDTDATNNGHSWWIIPKGDDCDRTDDTKQQDCFNIYSVDTEKQLLRIFRVGSDVDRNGRHKGSLVYDYANRQVLYCD
jgi:hypothetical protein